MLLVELDWLLVLGSCCSTCLREGTRVIRAVGGFVCRIVYHLGCVGVLTGWIGERGTGSGVGVSVSGN